MSQLRPRMRQVVDWSAALWAGVVAGVVFLVFNMIMFPIFAGGSPWVLTRLQAAIVLGDGVLPPPASFDLGITVVAMLLHFALSIAFGLLVAIVIHRWGLLVGVVGGAALGLALYGINFYALTTFFPWFTIIRSWIMVAAHIIFGAVAGGIYESLEVEHFVPVEAE